MFLSDVSLSVSSFNYYIGHILFILSGIKTICGWVGGVLTIGVRLMWILILKLMIVIAEIIEKLL